MERFEPTGQKNPEKNFNKMKELYTDVEALNSSLKRAANEVERMELEEQLGIKKAQLELLEEEMGGLERIRKERQEGSGHA